MLSCTLFWQYKYEEFKQLSCQFFFNRQIQLTIEDWTHDLMLHSLFIGRGDAIDYKNHGPIWAVNVLRKQLNFNFFFFFDKY